MSNPRRSVQQQHERFSVETFLSAFNRRFGADFRVIDEPNPPEAIIESRTSTRWVEVTTAFWTEEFAIDVYSYVTPGESHRPMRGGVHVGPDELFSRRFVEVVKKKMEKKTYSTFRDQHGPGYLIVSIQYPLFTEDTKQFMLREWLNAKINDIGCFRSIYLIYRSPSGYQVKRWNFHRQ